MFKGRLSQPLPVITPLDSVSNTSRRTKRSSQSNASSLSSACAEEAALREHATVLKKKYALELQKAQIQSEIEQSALDADIAAANAKVKVSTTNAALFIDQNPWME